MPVLLFIGKAILAIIRAMISLALLGAGHAIAGLGAMIISLSNSINPTK